MAGFQLLGSLSLLVMSLAELGLQMDLLRLAPTDLVLLGLDGLLAPALDSNEAENLLRLEVGGLAAPHGEVAGNRQAGLGGDGHAVEHLQHVVGHSALDRIVLLNMLEAVGMGDDVEEDNDRVLVLGGGALEGAAVPLSEGREALGPIDEVLQLRLEGVLEGL